MHAPLILVAKWNDGVSVLDGEEPRHELPGRGVRGLADDGRAGALAIVDGHSLARRSSDGEWSTIATSEADLSCCVAVGDAIYVGTDDARVYRVAAGSLEQLTGFDRTEGRESWFAGTAVIDGRVVGPPLGIRSMTASCDGAVLFASIHVGGIARSTDGGETWQPTIEIDHDVHEVCAHPTRPDVAIAAAAVGLCVSDDGGATWTVETDGLQDLYCAAVAFSGDDLLVSSAPHHFAPEGALYRRPIAGSSGLEQVAGGLPKRMGGIADTGCIASKGTTLAVADGGGTLYLSEDAGRRWRVVSDAMQGVSSVLVG